MVTADILVNPRLEDARPEASDVGQVKGQVVRNYASKPLNDSINV